jgi:hypothetical protein
MTSALLMDEFHGRNAHRMFRGRTLVAKSM